MVPYYGDFAEDDTVDIVFNAFTSDDPSESATITNFVNTDVHIHKDLGVDQRNNAAGITVSVDFDGITGNHAVKIDTNDDTVAGFWVTGSEYQVRIEGTTVDGATVNAWIGTFSIERAGGVLALLKAGTVDVNTKTFTAGSLANATFNADVGSTAHGTNIIALACRKILEELNLDHLLKVDTGVAADGDLEAFAVAGTIMGHLLSTSADATLYKASTDSLQAIRDHIGDGTNLTEAGGDGDHLTAVALSAAGVDAIWDEVITSAAHSTANSPATYLRQLWTTLVTRVMQCGDAGSATTIDLDDAASAVNDFYKGQVIAITSGTGAGQARACTAYAGDTKVATISPAWATNPDGDSWFAIINIGSAVVAAMADNAITAGALHADACTKIIDNFETQSQADPTGFHVNVKEVNGTAQTANDNGADINAILIDTARLYDSSGAGDADSPVAGSVCETSRWTRHFVKNEWRLDEVAAPDTLKIYKDDNTTESYGFTVYASASVNYRDPA